MIIDTMQVIGEGIRRVKVTYEGVQWETEYYEDLNTFEVINEKIARHMAGKRLIVIFDGNRYDTEPIVVSTNAYFVGEGGVTHYVATLKFK